jgi:hypothetical protein
MEDDDNEDDYNKQQLTFIVPGTGLSLSHLFLQSTPGSRYYY